MVLIHSLELSNAAIDNNLKRLINQIYKLLPMKEEGQEWRQLLLTITEEIAGMEYTLIEE
jgi:hypothetical protein